MFVADVFSSDGKNFAVCSGAGITKNMQVNRIKVSNSEYDVKDACFFESLIGMMQVSFEVEGPLPVPIGEVSIIN